MKKKTLPIEELVDRAAGLDHHIKNLEKQLEPLKKQISAYVSDNYDDKELLKSEIVLAGKTGEVKIVGSEKRADADPEKVLEILTKNGMGDKFFDIVKVAVAKLESVLSKCESDRLRKVIGVTIRQSFSIKV